MSVNWRIPYAMSWERSRSAATATARRSACSQPSAPADGQTAASGWFSVTKSPGFTSRAIRNPRPPIVPGMSSTVSTKPGRSGKTSSGSRSASQRARTSAGSSSSGVPYDDGYGAAAACSVWCATRLAISETWIACAMWSMKTSSIPSATAASTSATSMLRPGTVVSSPSFTAVSTTRQYRKIPMKKPATAWFSRSPRNVRNARGVNCCDTSCNDTIVIEKATPATVISDPAITESTVRAADAPAGKTSTTPSAPAARSAQTSRPARAVNASDIRPGRKR